MSKLVFGLDIGGTGIKGGLVNIAKGHMATDRKKLLTPKPATPKAVMEVAAELIKDARWSGPIGVGFPAIIRHNICYTATNIDKSWIGVDVAAELTAQVGDPVRVINDADAAALCELHFGAARNQKGTVMMVTIGTGIGCGLIYNGQLVPNCELGVTYLDNGVMLERHSSNAARKRDSLDWEAYGARLNKALLHIDRLMSPDLIVIGGGMAKKMHQFEQYIDSSLRLVEAKFQNEAGCIGAAMTWQ